MNQSESYFKCPKCKKLSLLQIVHDILVVTKNDRSVRCPECKTEFVMKVTLEEKQK